MTIPSNPSPNEQWTNDVTGVTYKWNGIRWITVESSEEIDLSGYVTEPVFTADQQRQDDVVTEALSTQDGIQQEQTVQNSQINALETQIQLLAQAKAVGKWNYERNISGGSVRPPATGTFYATHKDGADTVLMNWADARLIMISKTDLDGQVFTFSDFEEGDKVEILADDGSSACYGTITNDPNQEAYGNMVIVVERSTGGPPQSSVKAFLVSAYRPGSSNGNVDLDILDGRYVIKTGDEMTGILSIDNSSGTAIKVSKDSQENLKVFVDGTVSTTKTTFANDNFVTKTYVDDAINSVDPTTLLWKRVSKSAGDLQIGEFYISSSNHNIYLHPKAIGGIDLNMEARVNTVTGIKHLVSVHKFNGTINYSIVCTEIGFNNGSNNYIRLTSGSVLCEDYTSIDQDCRINIPGFTF